MLIAQLTISNDALAAFQKGSKTQLSRVAQFHAANGHEDVADAIEVAQQATHSL